MIILILSLITVQVFGHNEKNHDTLITYNVGVLMASRLGNLYKL